MAVAGDLVVNLTGNTRGLQSSLGRGRSMIGGFTSSITSGLAKIGLAAQGAKLIFDGLKAAIGTPLRLAGELEQTSLAFEVMIGNAEDAATLIDQIRTMAAKTPFQFPELLTSSKKLLAFGFAAKEIIPTLTSIGNISAGVGKEKIPQLILAFGQVRTAMKLRGQELRQFTEAGVPLAALLADIKGVDKTAIPSLVSAGDVSFEDVRAALDSASAAGGRFFNLMDRQSRTFLGLWSTLKDNVTIVLTSIGGELIKAFDFKSMIQSVLGFAKTFQTDWMPRIKAVIDIVARYFESWWIGVKGLFTALSAAWESFSMMFDSTTTSMLSDAFDGWLFYMRNVTELWQWAFAHVKLFGMNYIQVQKNIYTQGLAIFTSLAMAIVNLYANAFGLVLTNAVNFAKALKDAALGKGFDFVPTLDGLLDGVGKNFEDAGKRLGVGIKTSSKEIEDINAQIQKNEAAFAARGEGGAAAKEAKEAKKQEAFQTRGAGKAGGPVAGLEQGTSAAFAAIFAAGRKQKDPTTKATKDNGKKLDELIGIQRDVKANTDNGTVVASFA